MTEPTTLDEHTLAGSLAAAITLDHLTDDQLDDILAILERAGY
jgi:hypothetical protein